MKYKILINRKKHALVNDLFSHPELNFLCMSTSDIAEDTINHLEIFRPDVFLSFYDKSDNLLIGRLSEIRKYKEFDDVLFVIAGDSDSIELFKKSTEMSVAYIRLPVSVHSLAEQLVWLCDREAHRRSEEAARLERQQHAAAKHPEALSDEPDEELDAGGELEGKKSILVVDDDRNVLKVLKAILGEDYNVTTIVNGTMALKFLETRTPDLILLDYQMPVMTGTEVFKQIKERKECENVPIVFLTGVTDGDKVDEVMALNPSDYLLKPIEADRLKSTIAGLI